MKKKKLKKELRRLQEWHQKLTNPIHVQRGTHVWSYCPLCNRPKLKKILNISKDNTPKLIRPKVCAGPIFNVFIKTPVGYHKIWTNLTFTEAHQKVLDWHGPETKNRFLVKREPEDE